MSTFEADLERILNGDTLPSRPENVAHSIPLLAEGDVIEDRFALYGDRIFTGRNGSTAVFKAMDRETGRSVAIKTFVEDDLLTTRRVTTELGTHVAVDGECGFIPLVGMGTISTDHGDTRYTATPLRKSNLDVVPAPRSSEALSKVARMLVAPANALAGAEFMHRDIKTKNIVITPDDEGEVIDFGLVRPRYDNMPMDGCVESGESAPELTRADTVVGTLGYISLEALYGGVCNKATETFAFGVTMYKALTGSLPYDCDTPQVSAASLKKGIVSYPHAINPIVPTDLSHLAMAAIEVQPENRVDFGELANHEALLSAAA